jgi:hypothetical protein
MRNAHEQGDIRQIAEGRTDLVFDCVTLGHAAIVTIVFLRLGWH